MSKRFSKRPPRKGRKPASPSLPPVEVVVDRLGAQGDAIAASPAGALYIPFALPGERLRVRPGAPRGDGRGATLEAVLEAAPERVAPPCPHFGTCGGCALQHMAAGAEAAWKRDLVVSALRQRGFDAPPVAATVSLPPATRRRAVLGYRRTAGGLVLGFKARQSHLLVDLSVCSVLRPEITAALPALRSTLAPLLPAGAQGDIMVILAEEGLDLRLDLTSAPDLTTREGLAALAETLDLARLVLRVDGLEEPVAIRRPPSLRLGPSRLPLPVGAFLQPSAEGEAALLRLVEEGLSGVSGPVADLFCGLGTFALPLSQSHTVTAMDSEAAPIAALAATGRVTAQTRDLFRLPLMEAELAPFDAVVLDPPRAGARAQAEALAADGPGRIVAVSCNPATFARDARILCDGGYALTKVTPVDQFIWSPHVELVAVFDRTR